jgi:pimeloyl-ACP methyl ester carboxylesterase
VAIAEPVDLSLYDRALRSDAELIGWLAAGLHHRELIAYFGDAEFQLLAPLARAAIATVADDALPEVWIVPGIMGTQLGRPRAPPWPADLLWIDAADVIAGRLAELRLPDAQPLQLLGGISYTYLAQQLRLRAAGFRVRLWDYDWRQDIAACGARLAQDIAVSGSRSVALLAHSMGGLVARAALAQRGDLPVARVITLGTPHEGTLAVVQALRGTYPTVRRLAALDLRHTAEQLSAEVFSSFPSLYGMLPPAGALGALDLFDSSQWPQPGPMPDTLLLRSASTLRQQLAPLDARYCCIAGVRQRTATGLERGPDGFIYQVSSDGDGTVPVTSAAPAGAASHYLSCEHSNLPRDARVGAAVLDLLHTGHTQLLPASWQASDDRKVRVSDAELRANHVTKVDWRALSPDERRRYLNQLNLAPSQYAP